MEPIILLSSGHYQSDTGTPTYSLNCVYAEIVKKSGGIPLLALDDGLGDMAKSYAKIADGLLLTGGADVSTSLYKEEQLYDIIVPDLARDRLEMALIEEFVKLGKPIFGICRGLQILNSYFGGKLYQDIPDQLNENHDNMICHNVTITEGSILQELYGDKLYVNSYHHQGIKVLAPDFRATAYADFDEDNSYLIEAFEHKTLPIYGVQWHPERMTGTETVPENSVDSVPLIKDFINRCK